VKRHRKPTVSGLSACEAEAAWLALACFVADITLGELDRMSRAGRERVRAALGLSVEEFHDACEYIAGFQLEFARGLRSLRAVDKPIVGDESAAARLQ